MTDTLAKILESFAAFALVRQSTFPVGQPAKPRAWAALLMSSGYDDPEEISRALAELALTKTGEQWIEIGDLTAAIKARRHVNAVAKARALVRERDESRAASIRAHTLARVAEGMPLEEARYEAIGAFPDLNIRQAVQWKTGDAKPLERIGDIMEREARVRRIDGPTAPRKIR